MSVLHGRVRKKAQKKQMDNPNHNRLSSGKKHLLRSIFVLLDFYSKDLRSIGSQMGSI